MGSRISIGLVYAGRAEETATIELRGVLRYLTDRNGEITRGRASLDAEGRDWVEVCPRDDRDAERLFDLVVGGHYGEINLVADLLGRTRLAVAIRVVKHEHYFGFLVDFVEEHLLDSRCRREQQLATVTTEVVELVNDLYRATRFDYAFCDEEAEIEYSPQGFQAAGHRRYSLAFLPVQWGGELTLSVVRSSWAIDGMTPRA